LRSYERADWFALTELDKANAAILEYNNQCIIFLSPGNTDCLVIPINPHILIENRSGRIYDGNHLLSGHSSRDVARTVEGNKTI